MAKVRKMRKTDLLAHYVEHFSAFDIGFRRVHAREVFEELHRVCRQQLFETGEFTIPGIATFKLHKREARPGRNPATGREITISERSVVRARIAKQLKDTVVDW
jgi:integration host factor subunit alpha